jgi:hypothetical protein
MIEIVVFQSRFGGIASGIINLTLGLTSTKKRIFALTADPDAQSWKEIKGAIAERGPRGDLTPGHRTEIRSRWSEKNLYVLFICPYQELFLKPEPSTAAETNKLWEWDVAEVFILRSIKNNFIPLVPWHIFHVLSACQNMSEV